MRLSVPDLLPNTSYAIQVRATNNNGIFSEWGTRYSLQTIADTVLPTTPVNVVWVATGDSFTATWDAVTTNTNNEAISVTRYEIELSNGATTKIVAVPQTTSASVTYNLSFEENRNFFGTPKPSVGFRVRAVSNTELKSAWTTVTTANNAIPGAPTAPAVGSVATAGTDSIALAWTPPTDDDVVAYNVYVGTTAGFTPSSTNRIYAGNSTRITYTTTTYTAQYFKIRAVDKFGQESVDLTANASANSSFTSDTTAPNTPTALTASIGVNPNGSMPYANVSWTMTSPPSDLAGYVIYYRRAGSADNYQSTTFEKDATSGRVPLALPYQDYEFKIRAYDWQANYSAYSATTTATAPANSAPPTPATPTASANTMQVQVSLNGNDSTGSAMPADVASYEVYASTTTGFTPAADNMLGTMPAGGPVLVETFNIPASAATGTTQTWYIKVIAVDLGGLKSPSSAQTTASVGLISNANIGDAVITNAKISDLGADKITAGNGFINNITVKSKLTLGDASNVGTIETYDYTNSSGATGASFSKNGVIIKTGSIEAAALNIQVGQNVINPQYADFEGNPSLYNSIITYTGNGAVATVTVVADNTAKYNNQYLQYRLTGTSVNTAAIYLGSSMTDYNQTFEPGATYIMSWYARNPTSQPVTTEIRIKYADASFSPGGSITVPANTTAWTRYSKTITIPATQSTGLLNFYFNAPSPAAGAGIDIDGLQLEPRFGNNNNPSPWTPPGSTRIDGSIIRTGQIQSTGNATNTLARPVYDTDGKTVLYYGNPVTTIDTTRPAWFINTQGSAEFSNLSIRGNVVVGNPSGTTTGATTVTDTLTADTTSGSTSITNGSFQPSDTGRSISGPGIPAGATISTVNSTGTTVTISAAATATATGVTLSVVRPARSVSSVSSADYVPGTSGWTIRGDGMSEFPGMRVGSLDGKSIKAGSLTADRISSSSLTADVILSSGSFYASQGVTTFTVTTTSGSGTVTRTAGGTFTIDDVGETISSPGFLADGTKITGYTNANTVTVSPVATASGSSTASVIRGRTVSMSGDGIRMTDRYNKDVIVLPTDPDEAASFYGSVQATDLLVNGNLRITGTTNSIEGSLDMAIGVVPPKIAPTVTNSWSARYKNMNNGTASNLTYQSMCLLARTANGWALMDFFSGGDFYVYELDNNFVYTGTKQKAASSFLANFTIDAFTYAAGYYFIVGNDGTNNYGYRLDATTLAQAGPFNMGSINNYETYSMSTDGTLVSWLYLYYPSNGAAPSMQMNLHNLSFVYQRYHILQQNYPYGSYRPGAHTIGTLDTGVTAVTVETQNFNSSITYLDRWSYNTTSGSISTHLTNWNKPEPYPYQNRSGGIAWDGSHLYQFSAITGRLYTLSNVTADTSRTIGYSWYDSVAGRETNVTNTVTRTIPARSWTTISTQQPPDNGQTTDPNSVRIYIDNKRQADLGPGVTSVQYELGGTISGVAAPTTNAFTGISNPGTLVSKAVDTSPLISLSGDGAWRLGPITGDSVGAAFQIGGGTAIKKVTIGSFSGTTNTGGDLTITHGHGSTPTYIFVSKGNIPASAWHAYTGGVTSTTFVAHFLSGAGASAASISINGYYMCVSI